MLAVSSATTTTDCEADESLAFLHSLELWDAKNSKSETRTLEKNGGMVAEKLKAQSLDLAQLKAPIARKEMDLDDYSLHRVPQNGPADQIVTINVSGLRYQTFLATLEKFPDTLLGSELRRKPFYNFQSKEYFFDRHRSTFESILYFYQSGGTIKRPSTISLETFLEELEFFQFPDNLMLKVWESEGYVEPKQRDLPKNSLQRKLWNLIEHPDSSIWARILAFLSIFVITVSTITFCLETLTVFDHLKHLIPVDPYIKDNFSNPFFVIETVCIGWFTVEIIFRLAFCPSKWQFCKSFLNIVDIVAIIPYYINVIFEVSDGGALSFAVLRVLRLVRVFRIFKLSRHSRGLQILGMTFKSSIQELCLLLFFLGITVVLFSSAVYFLEMGRKDTKFVSIPEGFWFAIVTMTTVGYGDIVPKSPAGKVLGSCCAVVGVLVIALPVPVIVENFKHFYRQEIRVAHIHSIIQSKANDKLFSNIQLSSSTNENEDK